MYNFNLFETNPSNFLEAPTTSTVLNLKFDSETFQGKRYGSFSFIKLYSVPLKLKKKFKQFVLIV